MQTFFSLKLRDICWKQRAGRRGVFAEAKVCKVEVIESTVYLGRYKMIH